MNAQFKKGVLELCVLILLKNNDRYGYELIQKISEKFEISEGSIYPVLRRLTSEGYFTTYIKESNEGPSRKYYQLTKEGEQRLIQLSAEWQSFSNAVNELIKEGEHE